MASEKRIDDSNSFGSENELDKYGVWIKSDPQILTSLDGNAISVEEPEENDLLGDLFKSNAEKTPRFSDDFIDSLVLDPVIAEEKPEDDTSSQTDDNIIFNFDDISSQEEQSVPLLHKDDIIIDSPDFEVISMETIDPKEEAYVSSASETVVQKEETVDDNQVLNTQADSSDDSLPDFGSLQASSQDDQTDNSEPLPGADTAEAVSSQSFDSNKVVELLAKIVDELVLIQGEISSLKEILVQQQSVETEKPDSAYEMDQMEHEIITLTGDELDNVFSDELMIENAVQKNETGIGGLSLEDLQFLKGPVSFDEDKQEETAFTENLSELANIVEMEEDAEVKQLQEEGDKLLREAALDEAFQFDTLNDENIFDFKASDELEEEKILDVPRVEDISMDASLDDSLVEDVLDDALIDDLLIESGSIKDIPVELNLEEEEELGNLSDQEGDFSELPEDFELNLTVFDDLQKSFDEDEIEQEHEEKTNESKKKQL